MAISFDPHNRLSLQMASFRIGTSPPPTQSSPVWTISIACLPTRLSQTKHKGKARGIAEQIFLQYSRAFLVANW